MHNHSFASLRLRFALSVLACSLSRPLSAQEPQQPPQEAPASAASAEPASPDSFPDVVARVNGTDIAKSDLMRRAEAIRERVPPAEIGADFYQRVLADMVSGELLFQSVDSKGFTPSDEELTAELANQSQRFGGMEQFESALQQQGLSVDIVKAEMRKELSVQRWVENDVIPALTVTEEAKRAFYDENQDVMVEPKEFRAAHILISADQDAAPEAREQARTKAAALRGMIEAGQDFAELAAKNSGDPGSKDNGGELPWMSEGQTVPPFEAAMKAMSPGDLSPVVETQFGYHIIRLLETRGGGVTPYPDVQERIEQFLKQQGIQEELESQIEELRGAAAIEVFI